MCCLRRRCEPPGKRTGRAGTRRASVCLFLSASSSLSRSSASPWACRVPPCAPTGFRPIARSNRSCARSTRTPSARYGTCRVSRPCRRQLQKFAIAMTQRGSIGASVNGSKRSTMPRSLRSSGSTARPSISAPASAAKEPAPIWRPNSPRRWIFCAVGSPGNRAAPSWYPHAIYPSRPKPSLLFKVLWVNPRLLLR